MIDIQKLTVDTLPTVEEIALDSIQQSAKLMKEDIAQAEKTAHSARDVLDILLAKEGFHAAPRSDTLPTETSSD